MLRLTSNDMMLKSLKVSNWSSWWSPKQLTRSARWWRNW